MADWLANLRDFLKRHWLEALLAVIVFALFLPNVTAPFLYNWDDGAFIINNQRLRFSLPNVWLYLSKPYQNLYTPSAMLSLMLDRTLFGTAAPAYIAYHLHNYLLHAAAALFLMACCRRLGANRWAAFAAALIWAVHPQRVESVAWIVERKDLICGGAAFASLWCFLKSRLHPRAFWKWSAAAAALAIVSIGGKPASIALIPLFPMLAALLHHLRRQRIRDLQLRHPDLLPLHHEHLLRQPSPFKAALLPTAAAFLATLASWLITRTDNAGTLENRLYLLVHNLGWYPLSSLLPWPPLSPIYPPLTGWHQAIPWAAAAAAAAILILVAARLRNRSWLPGLAALLLVGATIFPILGFLRYTDFPYCDRYNYLVAAAIWGSLAVLFRPPRKLAIAAAVILGGIAAFRSLTYLAVWEDDSLVATWAIQQPPPPNIKALEVAVATGFEHQKADLLLAAADLYEKHPSLILVTGKTLPNQYRLDTIAVARGHAAFLLKDYPRAETEYRPVAHRLKEAAKNTFPVKYAADNVCRDLTAIALLHQNPQEAIQWLELEAEFLKGRVNSKLYRQNQESLAKLKAAAP